MRKRSRTPVSQSKAPRVVAQWSFMDSPWEAHRILSDGSMEHLTISEGPPVWTRSGFVVPGRILGMMLVLRFSPGFVSEIDPRSWRSAMREEPEQSDGGYLVPIKFAARMFKSLTEPRVTAPKLSGCAI